MTSDQATITLLSLAVVLVLAHVFAAACAFVKQPRFLGEMLVGVLLGSVLSPEEQLAAPVCDLAHWVGLMFLMFLCGTHVRPVLSRETRRASLILLSIGVAIPFVAVLALGSVIPIDELSGPAGGTWTILIVVAAGTAVTSIPVITRIFHDLGILRTEFASLVLGVAILDDMVLWIVVAGLSATTIGSDVVLHVGFSAAFLVVGLVVAPRFVSRLHRARWNVVERASPIAYACALLLLYMSLASALGVTVVLAAFVAGVGFAGNTHDRERYAACLGTLERAGYTVFIPLYFVMVGTKLQLGAFAPMLIGGFLVGSSIVRISAVWFAGRVAGFVTSDALNIAIAANARGGPGIMLASIVYECGLISTGFFTTLVVTAVVTSQLAAVWLGRVLRRGTPLLSQAAVQ